MNSQFAFYMVYGIGMGSPVNQYSLESRAVNEAKRLASENPGVRFVVLHVVDAYEVSKPEPVKIPLDDIPF